MPAFIILVIISLSAGLNGAFPITRIILLSVGNVPLTISTLGTAALALYATFAIGWLTKELLSNVLLPRAKLDSGVSNIIAIISRYTVLAIGVLTAISILGVDLSTFAIVGGGLSVGIGFGLQDLIANFISGILLLFERTLRPGDVIEVAGQRGRVAEMRMRSAVLRTGEDVDVYVPNKTLLTSVVSDYTNFKLGARKTINIGVSYDSDPIKVRDTLLEVVASHGLVLKEPAPEVFFIGFGSFTLDFEVAVSISESGRAPQILSDLHFMIFREFSKRGIEIPIPQQDFNLRATSISPIEQMLAPIVESNPSNGDSQRSNLEGGKSSPASSKRTQEEGAVKKLSAERIHAPSEKPNLPA
jgi:small-conductance mechanosensitive channel